MHFSERIKLQFGKKSHTFLYILQLFRIIVALLGVSLKKRVVTPNFLFGNKEHLLNSA